METSAEPCPLLRISRELRHCIYDHVIDLDPPNDCTWLYRDCWCNNGFGTSITKEPGTKFSIPWVNLLLTSKAINKDMASYHDLRNDRNEQKNRTWVLELNVSASGGTLKPTFWRHIPCCPTQVETLVATLDLKTEEATFWGDGGPRPIVRQLYQTLNRILHYGPAFGRKNLLPQPLKLTTLILQLKLESYENKSNHLRCAESLGGHPNYYRLCHFILQLKMTGLLFGYIDSVRIIDENNYVQREIFMEYVENAKVPKFWDRYGFEWGGVEN